MSDVVVLRAAGVDLVRDGRYLLRGIDFEVRQGEHWALLGANGAGKSTLLGLCGAVTHPTQGTVHVLGHQLGRVDVRELRGLIGHVNPRHPLRSPLTVRDVVLTGATGSIELVPRWSPSAEQSVQVTELLELLDLSGMTAARWDTLSQGERGRTLIARALMPDPELLLLDEPGTGLDVASRERLLDRIDKLRADQPELATVMVTHHLEELPRSTTHALLIRQGQAIAAGPAQEVLTSKQVSACFDYPIQVGFADGRWTAQTARRTD